MFSKIFFQACSLSALVFNGAIAKDTGYAISLEDIQHWFSKVDLSTPDAYFVQLARSIFARNPELLNLLDDNSASETESEWASREWQWIPDYQTSLMLGKEPENWAGSCFQKTSAKAELDEKRHSVKLTFQLEQGSSWTCEDYYLIGTVNGPQFISFFRRGQHTIDYHLQLPDEAQMYDLRTKGIRIFRMPGSYLTTVKSLARTAALFFSELTERNPEWVSKRNINFLNQYAQIKPFPQKRKVQNVDIDESLINSGDFFGIRRLDGLDPMLAWGMGSTTGHTTTALRVNGTLYVAESTAEDSYWPTNGIQMTPFKEWIKLAKEAGYSVVHVPLSPKYRAAYDEEKAYKFFKSVEGYNYGFQTLLWGWIDTIDDNYPCLPPTFERCLHWKQLEVLIPWVEKYVPTIGKLIFVDNWNVHVGTTGLSAPEILKHIDDIGLKPEEIHTIVESDDTIYDLPRWGKPDRGPAMVCCVFVCRMWKAAGIFKEINDQINCGELTNYDVYALNVFDSDRMGDGRPQACIDADPDNEVCQLMGEYSLHLNDVNSRAMFPHLAEKCPSRNPLYTHPDRC